MEPAIATQPTVSGDLPEPKPRVAILISVSNKEYDIAVEAIESLHAGCSGALVDLYIIDDGSPSFVGRQLVERFAPEMTSTHCDRLDRPEGYFGCCKRSFRGLNNVAKSGMSYDFVFKLDPDSLVLRRDLLPTLFSLSPDRRGVWGDLLAMNRYDVPKFFLDLLPVGWRKRQGERIEHDLEFRRFRPVWWTGMGFRALLRGFNFRFAPDYFIVMGGRTLDALRDSGFLTLNQERRHGFLASEEDLMITLAVRAVGHPVRDLGGRQKGWGFSSVKLHELPDIAKCRPFVVHPLKPDPAGSELRRQIKAIAAQGPGSMPDELSAKTG